MKFSKIHWAFALISSLFLVVSFSSGPAASSGQGYTGAPSANAGTEGNCGNCHRGGGFGTPQLNIAFDDEAIQEYVPGRKYRVTVGIGTTAPPAGYGFQAQFLTDANTTAGSMDEPGDNTQITTLANGRSYAEHTASSADSTFSFDWTAPDAGAGAVSFYAVGNAVNNNGGNSGDNGSSTPTVVSLTEGTISSVTTLSTIRHRMFPNPTTDRAELEFSVRTAGDFTLTVVGTDGKLVETRAVRAQRGQNELDLSLANYPAGLYVVSLTGQGSRLVGRLLKR